MDVQREHDLVLPARGPLDAPRDPGARFRAELDLGAHWYRAALRATREWSCPAEVFRRRRLHYVIGGEAFDLLLAIERLAAEAPPGAVSASELHRLLVQGLPPLQIPVAEFAVALGTVTYKAYLNYFYGVTVEEALLHAVELETDKAHALDAAVTDAAYVRVYDAELAALLTEFTAARGRSTLVRLNWNDAKEFTYWLFRRRLRAQPPARIASDTKKALDHLRRLRGLGAADSPDPLRPDAPDGDPRMTPPPTVAVIDLAPSEPLHFRG
ncbi:MAG: hypothetical protein FJ029_01655 [Actinobacteria bacterium]|nr:hypothetical protein [Actinomycetota bacterium]